MPEELPLIRANIAEVTAYVSPVGGGGKKNLPRRDPKRHSARVLQQLDKLAEAAKSRPPESRDEDATREIIAVKPEKNFELQPDSLGDKRSDARVVAAERRPDGRTIVDAPSPELSYLRRKVEDYGEKVTAKKKLPLNEKTIAPIAEIRGAELMDLAGPGLVETDLSEQDVRWFELACRGGVRAHPAEAAKSRAQVNREMERLGTPPPEEFLATERVLFLVRLSVQRLKELIARVDCVYEVDLAPPPVRDLMLLEHTPVEELQDFELERPAEDAPSVVLLDSGVMTRHPMLEEAILSAHSAAPNVPSVEDGAGHGTLMAGVSLYQDVGAAAEANRDSAGHWLQSSKIIEEDGRGGAAEENSHLWPATTERAVEFAEDEERERNRVFVMAVTAPLGPGARPTDTTSWSDCVDKLAFNRAQERLLVVSAGNADVNELGFADAYPHINALTPLENPAQAANALTVGAYSRLVELPDHPDYHDTDVVGTHEGISPWTLSGLTDGKVKPDIVMEGGNAARSPGLVGSADPLSVLSTRNSMTSPLGVHWGTSCAAANAGRFAAELWAKEPGLRPATIRGLIVHSASWTAEMVRQFRNVRQRLSVCGYGVPQFDWASSCLRDRATVFVEDEMPNVVIRRIPKEEPPKRKGARTYDEERSRQIKLIELPIPERELLELGNDEVELRVTLSYFGEPIKEWTRGAMGLELQWEMQGPQESEDEFKFRVNKLMRPKPGRAKTTSFPWVVGKQLRARGTMVSDRWTGPASFLAGRKLVAVYPVLGWWNQRKELETESQPFSLIVTVRVPGVDVYTPIEAAVTAQIEV